VDQEELHRVKRRIRFEVILREDTIAIRFSEPIYELVLQPDSAKQLGVTLLDYVSDCDACNAN